GLAAEILGQAGNRRHAGVVELTVAEARAAVAAHAIGLADEQLQAGALVGSQVVGRRRRLARGERIGEAVETGFGEAQRALERAEQLADVGKDQVYGVALLVAHAGPGRLFGRRAERAGILRQAVERRERPEDALVAVVEIVEHEAGIGR